ncbi:MAG: AAA family ATPase, partial [Rhodanobacteraceae bacterium]
TSDLLPSDVIGVSVYSQTQERFEFHPGPLFTNVLLADEINRTPPKTQSALLEAMEEARVTIDGTPIALPRPFMVCATQNPIEYEGTYPLPEAQLDRFMVKVEAAYPELTQELALIERAVGGFDARDLEAAGVRAITNAAEIAAAQEELRRVHVASAVQRYVYDVVAATRSHPHLALGASPRAALALITAAQGSAIAGARDFVTPDDVKGVAAMVLAHRLIVQPHAEIEGTNARDVLADVLAGTPVPREA